MSFKEFDTVVMKADMPSHGLKSGDVGAVVQVYSADAIEVEFVTALRPHASISDTLDQSSAAGWPQRHSCSASIRRCVRPFLRPAIPGVRFSNWC